MELVLTNSYCISVSTHPQCLGNLLLSHWCTFDEIKFFRVVQYFFFSFFEIITHVFILKQLFASGSVIIGEYSPIITLLISVNNC